MNADGDLTAIDKATRKKWSRMCALPRYVTIVRRKCTKGTVSNGHFHLHDWKQNLAFPKTKELRSSHNL